MKNLLIVESPAKAKTISKYLGKDYIVMASFGHIRDLPSKNGSVEPDNDFKLHYQISPKSTKHVKMIVDAAKNCDRILLAPDPDREGEAIAWHIVEALKQKKALKADPIIERVVFNSITKSSVIEAIKNPRKVDMDLVNAQQARRALDYLVGFTLSPILWRKLPGSRSAGRVQSVALRIICDREEEIEAFKSREYWDIKIDLETEKSANFTANLFELEGKKLDKFTIIDEKTAGDIKANLDSKKYRVTDVVKKQTKRRPNPPFITSSLQQEAARKLGYSAKQTMMLAQRLYEGIEIDGANQGLITYMRTDSIIVAKEAIDQARDYILQTFGNDYLPESVNVFKSKVKNAQEAHEAIRPVDPNIDPAAIKNYLDPDQFKLYDLIFKRMLASQMSDVIFDQVTATVTTIPDYAKARATGSVIKFDGFYRVYKEDQDDAVEEDVDKLLPPLESKQDLSLIDVRPDQHFTLPPPRYSEASLVKKLEELGIGRPSTYANIISVLQDRGYVKIDSKRFFPEERGRIVTTFLKEFFVKYVEYGYTASIEDELDVISNGDLDWKKFLANFWGSFNANILEVAEKPFPDVLEILNKKIGGQVFGTNEDGTVKDECPTCKDGKLGLRLGKFGSFIGCSNYPECKHTMHVFDKSDQEIDADGHVIKSSHEPKTIGQDPETGLNVIIKLGPYGLYLELEGSENIDDDGKLTSIEEVKKIYDDYLAEFEKSEKERMAKAKKAGKKPPKPKKPKKAKVKKPKRISLPKKIDPEQIDIKQALGLLSLPREVGLNPHTGLKVVASIGPFGPYVMHDKKYASLKEDDVLEIGINRAIDLLEEAANRPKRAARKKKVPAKGAKKK